MDFRRDGPTDNNHIPYTASDDGVPIGDYPGTYYNTIRGWATVGHCGSTGRCPTRSEHV